MEFLKFFREYSPKKTSCILILSMVYGITAGLFPVLVMTALLDIIAGKNYFFYMIALPLFIAVQIGSCRKAESLAANVAGTTLEKLLFEILETIRDEELVHFEKRKHSDIRLLIENTRAITEGALQSIRIFQNLVMLSTLWICIFTLSTVAGVIFLLMAGLYILASEVFQKVSVELLIKIGASENILFKIFDHFLKGFKETRIDRKKSQDIFHNYLQPVLAKLKDMKQNVAVIAMDSGVLFQSCMFLLLCIDAFVFPFFTLPINSMQLMVLIIYAVKPSVLVISAIPVVNQAQAAMISLKQFLEENNQGQPRKKYYAHDGRTLTSFKNITFNEVMFTYHEDDGTPGFSVGPVNFSIQTGDLIFFSGGNGSGKSSFVNILAGLYSPDSGDIYIDGKKTDMFDHRDLFSAVFSDFHLFDSLYGTDISNEQKIMDLLALMRLKGKTDYIDQRFTNLDLSAGQRRRLALIASLMEDKTFYIFDEWAADQDPYFRKYFYEKLLPSLKEQGKTALIVTHDDQYYHIADRVITMKDGKIENECAHDKKPHKIAPVSDSPLFFNSPPENGDNNRPNTGSLDETAPPEPDPGSSLEKRIKARAPDIKKAALLMAACGAITVTLMQILFSASSHYPESSGRLFFSFIAALILNLFINKRVGVILAEITEGIISATTSSIINKVREINFFSFEKIGVEHISKTLTGDIKDMAASLFFLTRTFVYLITMVSMTVYLLFIAPPVFLIGMVILVFAGPFYFSNQIRIKKNLKLLQKKEIAFFKTVTHLLEGFKELKLNARKNDAFFAASVKKLYSEVDLLKRRSANHINTNTILVYGAWTLVMGLLPILAPIINISDIQLFHSMVILAFMPINIFILVLPHVIQGNEAIQRIMALEQTLETAGQDILPKTCPQEMTTFKRLSLKDITFHYHDDKNDYHFGVGPLNADIKAGELIFITGGNGSGKSTLINILTGLYMPDEGHITLNGEKTDIRRHRSLFATIFSDFHLFDRLYGLKDIDQNRLAELLRLMRIENKVEFIDGHFSTLNLSSGQKKRLALVAALMENRQIYIFDEWAAEQDPYFRKFFYTTLLPGLTKQGKTVISITHHDQYFHIADRIIHMEYGQIKMSE